METHAARHMHEHDPHGFALLVVWRRGESEPKPRAGEPHRQDRQDRRGQAGKGHESKRIGQGGDHAR